MEMHQEITSRGDIGNNAPTNQTMDEIMRAMPIGHGKGLSETVQRLFNGIIHGNPVEHHKQKNKRKKEQQERELSRYQREFEAMRRVGLNPFAMFGGSGGGVMPQEREEEDNSMKKILMLLLATSRFMR